jgi:hypothetical protein
MNGCWLTPDDGVVPMSLGLLLKVRSLGKYFSSSSDPNTI